MLFKYLTYLRHRMILVFVNLIYQQLQMLILKMCQIPSNRPGILLLLCLIPSISITLQPEKFLCLHLELYPVVDQCFLLAFQFFKKTIQPVWHEWFFIMLSEYFVYFAICFFKPGNSEFKVCLSLVHIFLCLTFETGFFVVVVDYAVGVGFRLQDLSSDGDKPPICFLLSYRFEFELLVCDAVKCKFETQLFVFWSFDLQMHFAEIDGTVFEL